MEMAEISQSFRAKKKKKIPSWQTQPWKTLQILNCNIRRKGMTSEELQDSPAAHCPASPK